jgi:hypothetical protein
MSDSYLEILLNVSQEIRTDILTIADGENDDKIYSKQEYVAGSSACKYLAFGSYMHWDQTKIIQSLEKFILENQMDELEWPHLEVFKAATRLDTMNMEKMLKLEESASEWVRIFKSLKAYIFLALKEREYSEAAIDILETFTARFSKIREECLDESLEIMIKSLQFLYQPDIEMECKDNIQKYLEGLYFGRSNSIDSEGQGLTKQKDFVYNAVKNFAELN